MDEVDKSELGQRSRKLASEFSAGVGRTAENISKQTQQLSESSVFQSVAHVRFVDNLSHIFYFT